MVKHQELSIQTVCVSAIIVSSLYIHEKRIRPNEEKYFFSIWVIVGFVLHRKFILEQFAQEEETTFLQSFVQSIDTLQFKMQSIVQDAEYNTLGSHTILCNCRVLCRVQDIILYFIFCTFWVVNLYSAFAEYCAECGL